MQETVTDPDTKLEIEKARKFARSIHSAVEKSPENVTADQIDLLVEKSKLVKYSISFLQNSILLSTNIY